MKEQVIIDGQAIGPGKPPYIICELSANHGGCIERALKLIDAAIITGANAIKIQTYTPDTLTINHNSSDFVIKKGLWAGKTLYELYKSAFTPFEWHAELFAYARAKGITLFSTPFDETAVELLSALDAPAYKIASFEANDLALINRVASEKKPLIISTGLSTPDEISDAVSTARSEGNYELVLLHCVSCYPAEFEQANLLTMRDIANRYNVLVGLSDHTPGTACSVAAVTLGANVIEKHFTLSREDGGVDAAFSLEPSEFKRLVEDCRSAWLSIGKVDYERSLEERSNMLFRRSLYVTEDINSGGKLAASNIRSIRPGFGISPKYLASVLGKRASRALKRGQALNWHDIDIDSSE